MLELLADHLLSPQAEAVEKEAQLAAVHEQRAASDADWEARMKEAVSSAEQWKEFAEKLGVDKNATEAALAEVQASLQVRCCTDHRSFCKFYIAAPHQQVLHCRSPSLLLQATLLIS